MSTADSPPNPVSVTRLYLGNLPKNVTKADIEGHFKEHPGKIREIKLMQGFGFVEFDDERDAKEIVPAYHGTTFMGERLTVQYAKGGRRETAPYHERPPPRPRRTPFRMSITNLPTDTSWQDLKDFARQSGQDVVYSEVAREKDGRGYVEYETLADLNSAVEKLDNGDFKGQEVHCISDPQDETTFRQRQRSRSPQPYRRGGYQQDRGPPPRNYSPRRDHDGYSGYNRRRSPPRDYYGRYDRSPPRGHHHGPDDSSYVPPGARRYDDPYANGTRGPPRQYDDPYSNGHGYGGGGYNGPGGRPSYDYSRPPYDGPPRGGGGRRSPPPSNRGPPYEGGNGYDRPRHW